MTAKIMISMPEDFLAELDDVAKKEHRSRSELIREATREYIVRKHAPTRPIDNPRVKSAFDSLDKLKSKWPAGFDSSEAVRRMRDSRYAK